MHLLFSSLLSFLVYIVLDFCLGFLPLLDLGLFSSKLLFIRVYLLKTSQYKPLNRDNFRRSTKRFSLIFSFCRRILSIRFSSSSSVGLVYLNLSVINSLNKESVKPTLSVPPVFTRSVLT